jgi:drug/metabolite transporter (DMT)-like permease
MSDSSITTPPASKRPLGAALSLLMVFTIGMGWAGGYALNRAAVEADIPLLPYAFLQLAGSAVILSVVLALRRERPPLDFSHLKLYAISGVTAVGIPYLAIIYAAPHVPVGVLTLDLTLEPAFTYAFALLLALERFHRVRLVGLVIGLIGLAIILVPETGLPSRTMVPWVLLGLLAPISWAIFSVYIAVVRRPEQSGVLICWGLFTASALAILPALVITGDFWWFTQPFDNDDLIVLGAILYNPIVWFLAVECVRLTGPVFYSLWGYIGTPAGMVLGILFFDERHSLWIWGALVLLIIGLYLVNRTSAEARRSRREATDFT